MSEKERLLADTEARWLGGIVTLDPGIRHTGHAYWNGLHRTSGRRTAKPPQDSGVSVQPAKLDWESAVDLQSDWLRNYLYTWWAEMVVIEYAAFWPKSERGYTAAVRGDLLKLAYLIGSLARTARTLPSPRVTVVLMPPMDWKGTMSKAIMKRRVTRALGRSYKDHECDAVAMGLRIQGAL